jgi:ABC-type polysaccharide/polyol phosphate transport system ATPase subunit
MNASVTAQGVGVKFLFDRQRRVVTPMLARLHRRGSAVWGLRGIDLAIGSGEGVALVGPTGSGKTTLLRSIAGVLAPDAGRLDVRGRVGSLLSVDAGLLAPLTGRENSVLLGVLYGLPRREAQTVLDRIKERSGLEEAFERPVSSYSQGMRARLGFAVADCASPDVLLLDEVHEALDHEFRAVVGSRARELRDSGGIVIAAGHDHHALAQMCDRAVLLVGGRVEAVGSFDAVLARYL